MTETDNTGAPLRTVYYDGRSPQARPVTVQRVGNALHISGLDAALTVPLKGVRWPERQRHGTRLCYLPTGGMLSHDDGTQWDAWALASGHQEPMLVGWMQNWSAVLVAGLVCVLLVVAFWMWAIPWLSRVAVAMVPASVERSMGDRALQTFEATLLKPSALPAAQQAEIRQRFESVMAKAFPLAQAPGYQLHFRASNAAHLGPNAFALPGGHLVLTDELVKLLSDQPDALAGVLAHEWGHVQHQHGLRMVVQTALLASLASVVMGDVSGLIVALPAVLSEQAYSREAERQADQEAVNIMRRSGISPAAMGVFFERIEQWRRQQKNGAGIELPIAFSSHPSDEERVKFFKEAR